MNIYIAGVDGMIGSELKIELEKKHHILGTTYLDLDLLNYSAVDEYLRSHEIDLVIMAAAKVGGGVTISKNPVEFLEDNLLMQINLMRASEVNHIRKFIFLASAAIYPADAINPIGEEQIMMGPLDTVQESYALAKLVGVFQTKYYNLQKACKFITVIPANLIPTRDNGQVVFSLLRQMNEARDKNTPNITIWGSGNQRREFIFVDDVVQAMSILLDNFDELNYDMYNIGMQTDISIKELAFLIKDISGYKGDIVFDASKPEGVHKRILDSSRIQSLGFKPKIEIREGLVKIQKVIEKNFCSADVL